MSPTFMLWSGFLGAWLLFLGPIYQAALELRDHDVARDRIQAAFKAIPRPTPLSRWWFLLPPAKLVLEARRRRAMQQMYKDALTAKDFADLVSFMEKSTGWAVVACGALLLATQETFNLVHSVSRGFAVLIGMVAACFIATSARIRMGIRMVEEKNAKDGHEEG